jgi:beta-lactamase class A
MKNIYLTFLLPTLLLSGVFTCCGQQKSNTKLRFQIQTLTAFYHATIGIAVIHIETGDTFTLNNDKQFPMQSVYKFPLAITVLHLVDEHKLSLSQKVHVTKEDVAPPTWSPLKQKYPEGNVDATLADLLYYSVSMSDNVACDLLFKIIKGPKQSTNYMRKLGFKDINLLHTEHQMHSDMSLQFKNWSSAMGMSKLLQGFYKQQYLSDSSNNFLMHLMTESSNSFMRIKALLPPEITVAHKTGTSGEDDNGVRSACNDVGLITLPDGTHLALTVFVSRSKETYENDEKIIALISKAVYENFTGKQLTYFVADEFISANNDTLPYRLLSPHNENIHQKYPLVIYLHGSGGRGNDNKTPLRNLQAAFTDSLNRSTYPCYVLVPQCPVKDAWVTFPNFPNSLATDIPTTATKQTLDLIHELIRSNNIDSNRIYVTGFSMGGEGTFDIISREPELFACAVPLASVADTSKAKLVKDIPIWAFHGSDDQINEAKYTRMMIDAIQKAGGHPKYTELPGLKHPIINPVYSNTEVWKWMFEQRR